MAEEKRFSTGWTLSYHDVNYQVEVPNKCCKKPDTKTILHNLSGIFQPGTMNALLGSSGSGKTSLLDILAGRKDSFGLEGTILVNGKKQDKDFKNFSGYVVQDDVVMGTLTVKENLHFSANLRLPKSMICEEKERKVIQTINELGLSHVSNSLVGTDLIRGVSGGERKRVNIGMEMITSPSILFLDEPTSGLDANSAYSVMNLLKRLAASGKTIVFSIHQPRYSILTLFDQLVLLSKGRCVYQGSNSSSLNYFESIGYHCEPFNNPADFFLDIINGDVQPTYETHIEVIDVDGKDSSIANGGHVPYVTINMDESNEKDSSQINSDKDDIAKSLETNFKKSDLYNNGKNDNTSVYNLHQTRDAEVKIESKNIGYAINFFEQFYYISARAMKNIYRNPAASLIQCIAMSIFAIVIGLVYRNIGNDLKSGITNRVGVLFLMLMNQTFSNLSAIPLLISERSIFLHEKSNGYYRVSSYLFAKLFSDIIPMRIIPSTLFAIIVFFLVGFNGSFFALHITLISLNLSAVSLIILISSKAGNPGVGSLLAALSFVLMMIFGGFLVQLDTIDKYFQWVEYLSIFRYAYAALQINEFKNLELCTVNSTLDTILCNPNAGNLFLEEQGVRFTTRWDFWQNHLALLIFMSCMFLLTYISLSKLKKQK